MTQATHLREILLVDDDRVDAAIVRRVLRDLAVTNKLVHMADGARTLAYLRGQDGELPCVILLDLNMPRMNGFEFLQIVKADDVMKSIPVVVITTSNEPRDRATSFECGAVAYVVKCIDYGEFRDNMRIIRQYLTAVQPLEKLTRVAS